MVNSVFIDLQQIKDVSAIVTVSSQFFDVSQFCLIFLMFLINAKIKTQYCQIEGKNAIENLSNVEYCDYQNVSRITLPPLKLLNLIICVYFLMVNHPRNFLPRNFTLFF